MPPSVLHTDFCTVDALSQWVTLMNHEESGHFSLSPLTSPESTPNVSPQAQSADLLIAPVPPLRQEPPCDTAYMPLSGQMYSSTGSLSTQHEVKIDSTRPKKLKPPHRKAKQHSAAQAARAHRRTRERTNAANSPPQPRAALYKKYVEGATAIPTTFKTAQDARVARTGFIGINDRSKSKKVYRLDEVTGPSSEFKFRLVKWDGRTPLFVTDNEGRALVICAGRPEDDGWDILMDLAADALEVSRNLCFTSHQGPKDHTNRRGDFVSLHCGVSFGGGQTSPSNLSNNKVKEIVADWLNHQEPFRRLAGFTSSVILTWAKDLHTAYIKNAREIYKDSGLNQIFPNSVFSAATYNLGPQTVCTSHKDFSNVPYGYCAVTSLGSFDATQGGHLILWELELVIEFPPGSTILLPSALITHSNTSISPHEKRYSFTQYTAGGLFRWVAHNCKTKAKYLAGLSPQELTQYTMKEGIRWFEGLQLMPIVKAL